MRVWKDFIVLAPEIETTRKERGHFRWNRIRGPLLARMVSGKTLEEKSQIRKGDGDVWLWFLHFELAKEST